VLEVPPEVQQQLQDIGYGGGDGETDRGR